MAIAELITIRNVAEESFNNEEINPIELTFFAMQLQDDETPQRFFEANIANVNGLLLITDVKVIFVGKSASGRRMGVDINYKDIKSVSVEPDKFNRKLSKLIITDEVDYYTFSTTRFGASTWADYIRDKI